MIMMSHNGTRQPMFSFLTSAYKTERYIRTTIESVLAQTRSDWELIVVDNGPSDEMADIVGEYTSDPRIQLIRQENAGMGGGVRAAAAAATGRYVCPLNSDDSLERDYCERVGAILESEPEIDALGGDATLFWEDCPDRYFRTIGRGVIHEGTYFRSISRRNVPDTRHSVLLADLLEHGVPHYAGAFRREIWHAYGGFEPGADVEGDIALWLRLAAAGCEIRISPAKLARQLLRADSMSHDVTTLQHFEQRILDAYLLVARESGLSESELSKFGMIRRLRYERAMCEARSAFLQGDVDSARPQAHEAFRQRRTARSAVVVAMLYTSPTALRAIHPFKGRLENAVRRAWFADDLRRQREIAEGRL